jgi:hypothetical protein
MKRLLLGLVLLGQVASAYGDSGNPSFEATCRDVNTHGYRGTTNFAGEEMEESWTTSEKFGSTWDFKFSPPNNMQIDGKSARILAQNPGIIIAMETPGNNGNAASVWMYAIHLGLQTVAASQVNAFGGLDEGRRGVKARSTNFDCRFVVE